MDSHALVSSEGKEDQQRLEKCWVSIWRCGGRKTQSPSRLAHCTPSPGRVKHTHQSLYRRGRGPGERKEPLGQLRAAAVFLSSGLPLSPGRAPHCAPKLTSLQTVQPLNNLQRCRGPARLNARLKHREAGFSGMQELGAGPDTWGGAWSARGGVTFQTAGSCGSVVGEK